MAEQTGSVTGVAVEGAIVLTAEVERNGRRGSRRREKGRMEQGGRGYRRKGFPGKGWWGRGRGLRGKKGGRGGVGMNYLI